MCSEKEVQVQEVKGWLSAILETDLPEGGLYEILEDGVILCNVINKIRGITNSVFPGKMKISFKKMENICYFIENARELGVPDSENFQTIDLYENKNIQQVILCIYSLSRNLYKNGRTDLPVIGPKLTAQQKITFNKEQVEEAKRTISLQYGYARPREEKNV